MAPCPHCREPGAPGGAPRPGARTRAAARVRWPIRAALLALTFAIAALGVAPRMIGMLEGVRSGFAPAAPLAIVCGVVAALTFVAGFLRVQRPVCSRCDTAEPAWLLVPVVHRSVVASSSDAADDARPTVADAGRRSFLASAGAVGASGVATAAAGAAGVLLPNAGWTPVARNIFAAEVEKNAPVQRPEWAGSRVKSYRRLGRTDALVSDISLGSGGIDDIQVAIRAIERGVNYFDTAPDYSRNGSELLLGKAIRETGGRDKMFLATKFCTADGHLPIDTPVPEIIKAVEASLGRLQTDYVDLVHIHSCDRVERLLAPNFHEAFDRLKEQGKARFLGVSSHTPRLEEVANAAIDSKRFDVMMLAYHHGLWPGLSEIVDRAHAHDVGVVAMKTLKGAKAESFGMRDEAVAYSQAAFRWVLQNPSVSCLVISFTKVEQCDEYLYASGTPVEHRDLALLQRYDNLASADYCRPHCGQCLDACPAGLPIDTVLRYDMYFADYGREAIARDKYAKLVASGLDAGACAACPAPCAGTCPYELPIRAKMVRAHERLRTA
jgi:aryl-alcohol dehydrogenase-like predicted oxidoreductase